MSPVPWQPRAARDDDYASPEVRRLLAQLGFADRREGEAELARLGVQGRPDAEITRRLEEAHFGPHRQYAENARALGQVPVGPAGWRQYSPFTQAVLANRMAVPTGESGKPNRAGMLVDGDTGTPLRDVAASVPYPRDRDGRFLLDRDPVTERDQIAVSKALHRSVNDNPYFVTDTDKDARGDNRRTLRAFITPEGVMPAGAGLARPMTAVQRKSKEVDILEGINPGKHYQAGEEIPWLGGTKSYGVTVLGVQGHQVVYRSELGTENLSFKNLGAKVQLQQGEVPEGVDIVAPVKNVLGLSNWAVQQRLDSLTGQEREDFARGLGYQSAAALPAHAADLGQAGVRWFHENLERFVTERRLPMVVHQDQLGQVRDLIREQADLRPVAGRPGYYRATFTVPGIEVDVPNELKPSWDVRDEPRFNAVMMNELGSYPGNARLAREIDRKSAPRGAVWGDLFNSYYGSVREGYGPTQVVDVESPEMEPYRQKLSAHYQAASDRTSTARGVINEAELNRAFLKSIGRDRSLQGVNFGIANGAGGVVIAPSVGTIRSFSARGNQLGIGGNEEEVSALGRSSARFLMSIGQGAGAADLRAHAAHVFNSMNQVVTGQDFAKQMFSRAPVGFSMGATAHTLRGMQTGEIYVPGMAEGAALYAFRAPTQTRELFDPRSRLVNMSAKRLAEMGGNPEALYLDQTVMNAMGGDFDADQLMVMRDLFARIRYDSGSGRTFDADSGMQFGDKEHWRRLAEQAKRRGAGDVAADSTVQPGQGTAAGFVDFLRGKIGQVVSASPDDVANATAAHADVSGRIGRSYNMTAFAPWAYGYERDPLGGMSLGVIHEVSYGQRQRPASLPPEEEAIFKMLSAGAKGWTRTAESEQVTGDTMFARRISTEQLMMRLLRMEGSKYDPEVVATLMTPQAMRNAEVSGLWARAAGRGSFEEAMATLRPGLQGLGGTGLSDDDFFAGTPMGQLVAGTLYHNVRDKSMRDLVRNAEERGVGLPSADEQNAAAERALAGVFGNGPLHDAARTYWTRQEALQAQAGKNQSPEQIARHMGHKVLTAENAGLTSFRLRAARNAGFAAPQPAAAGGISDFERRRIEEAVTARASTVTASSLNQDPAGNREMLLMNLVNAGLGQRQGGRDAGTYRQLQRIGADAEFGTAVHGAIERQVAGVARQGGQAFGQEAGAWRSEVDLSAQVGQSTIHGRMDFFDPGTGRAIDIKPESFDPDQQHMQMDVYARGVTRDGSRVSGVELLRYRTARKEEWVTAMLRGDTAAAARIAEEVAAETLGSGTQAYTATSSNAAIEARYKATLAENQALVPSAQRAAAGIAAYNRPMRMQRTADFGAYARQLMADFGPGQGGGGAVPPGSPQPPGPQAHAGAGGAFPPLPPGTGGPGAIPPGRAQPPLAFNPPAAGAPPAAVSPPAPGRGPSGPGGGGPGYTPPGGGRLTAGRSRDAMDALGRLEQYWGNAGNFYTDRTMSGAHGPTIANLGWDNALLADARLAGNVSGEWTGGQWKAYQTAQADWRTLQDAWNARGNADATVPAGDIAAMRDAMEVRQYGNRFAQMRHRAQMSGYQDQSKEVGGNPFWDLAQQLLHGGAPIIGSNTEGARKLRQLREGVETIDAGLALNPGGRASVAQALTVGRAQAGELQGLLGQRQTSAIREAGDKLVVEMEANVQSLKDLKGSLTKTQGGLEKQLSAMDSMRGQVPQGLQAAFARQSEAVDFDLQRTKRTIGAIDKVVGRGEGLVEVAKGTGYGARQKGEPGMSWWMLMALSRAGQQIMQGGERLMPSYELAKAQTEYALGGGEMDTLLSSSAYGTAGKVRAYGELSNVALGRAGYSGALGAIKEGLAESQYNLVSGPLGAPVAAGAEVMQAMMPYAELTLMARAANVIPSFRSIGGAISGGAKGIGTAIAGSAVGAGIGAGLVKLGGLAGAALASPVAIPALGLATMAGLVYALAKTNEENRRAGPPPVSPALEEYRRNMAAIPVANKSSAVYDPTLVGMRQYDELLAQTATISGRMPEGDLWPVPAASPGSGPASGPASSPASSPPPTEDYDTILQRQYADQSYLYGSITEMQQSGAMVARVAKLTGTKTGQQEIADVAGILGRGATASGADTRSWADAYQTLYTMFGQGQSQSDFATRMEKELAGTSFGESGAIKQLGIVAESVNLYAKGLGGEGISGDQFMDFVGNLKALGPADTSFIRGAWAMDPRLLQTTAAIIKGQPEMAAHEMDTGLAKGTTERRALQREQIEFNRGERAYDIEIQRTQGFEDWTAAMGTDNIAGAYGGSRDYGQLRQESLKGAYGDLAAGKTSWDAVYQQYGSAGVQSVWNMKEQAWAQEDLSRQMGMLALQGGYQYGGFQGNPRQRWAALGTSVTDFQKTLAGMQQAGASSGQIIEAYGGFAGSTVEGFGLQGLNEAETRLRRQWQKEDLDHQKSLAVIRKSFWDQEFALQKELFEERRQWQIEDFALQEKQLVKGQSRQQTARQWQMEDWSFADNLRNLQGGWQLEDMDEAIRYSSGRQKRKLKQQKERMLQTRSMEDAQTTRERERDVVQWGWQDDDFKVQMQQLQEQKKRAQEVYRIESALMDLRKASSDMEFAAQMAAVGRQQERIAIEEQFDLVRSQKTQEFGQLEIANEMAVLAARQKRFDDEKALSALRDVWEAGERVKEWLRHNDQLHRLAVREQAINDFEDRNIKMSENLENEWAAMVQRIIEMMRKQYGVKPPEGGEQKAFGGLVTTQQDVTVAEGGQPELILPLNNPARARQLLRQSEQNGRFSFKTKEGLLVSVTVSMDGGFNKYLKQNLFME